MQENCVGITQAAPSLRGSQPTSSQPVNYRVVKRSLTGAGLHALFASLFGTRRQISYWTSPPVAPPVIFTHPST